MKTIVKQKNIPFTKSEFKKAFTEVLETFPVKIFNGEADSHSVPLPQAITSISSDLRTVKGQVLEVNQIISGIKRRKKIFDTITNLYDLIKKTTIIKIVGILLGICMATLGSIQVINFIIAWLH